MRIYVAGSSAELERAKRAMQLVTDAGHEVTSSWVQSIEQSGERNPADMAAREAAARQCMRELLSSQLVWALLSHNSKGLYWEMGAATIAHVRVVATGPSEIQVATVFTSLCSLRLPSDEDMAYFLANERQRERDNHFAEWARGRSRELLSDAG